MSEWRSNKVWLAFHSAGFSCHMSRSKGGKLGSRPWVKCEKVRLLLPLLAKLDKQNRIISRGGARR